MSNVQYNKDWNILNNLPFTSEPLLMSNVQYNKDWNFSNILTYNLKYPLDEQRPVQQGLKQ